MEKGRGLIVSPEAFQHLEARRRGATSKENLIGAVSEAGEKPRNNWFPGSQVEKKSASRIRECDQ